MDKVVISNSASLSHLIQRMGASPAEIDKADRWAKSNALRKMRTRVVRQAASDVGIPQKHIRRRMKQQRRKHHGTTDQVLWGGTNRIIAASLGSPKQTKTGVKVGRWTFDGHFLQKIYSHEQRVWHRKGKERFPVMLTGIDIQVQMENAFIGNEAFAKNEYAEQMERTLDLVTGVVKFRGRGGGRR